MEINFDDKSEREPTEQELLDEGSISAQEEAFMRGYSDDEETITCAECDAAIREKPITKVIDGETCHFCSKECVQDFEESMA